MAKKTIVGSGATTVNKQTDLGAILDIHMRISKSVLSQSWTDGCYYYFDANAGPGVDENGITGSPLIFLDKATSNNLNYRAFFIEENADCYNSLVGYVGARGGVTIINGDHKEKGCGLISASRLGKLGLLYHDPNGVPSFEWLASLSRQKEFKAIDFMISLGANGLKRARRRNGDTELLYLHEYLATVNKKRWIIRKPQGKWQWTFVIGSNWEKFPNWANRYFYDLNSPEGKQVLINLSLTKKEVAEEVQTSFFGSPVPTTHHIATIKNT